MNNRIECVYVNNSGCLNGLKRWLDPETGKCYIKQDDHHHVYSGFKFEDGYYISDTFQLVPINLVKPNKTVSKPNQKKIMLDTLKLLIENEYYEEAHEILTILQDIQDKEKQNA